MECHQSGRETYCPRATPAAKLAALRSIQPVISREKPRKFTSSRLLFSRARQERVISRLQPSGSPGTDGTRPPQALPELSAIEPGRDSTWHPAPESCRCTLHHDRLKRYLPGIVQGRGRASPHQADVSTLKPFFATRQPDQWPGV